MTQTLLEIDRFNWRSSEKKSATSIQGWFDEESVLIV